MKPVFTENAPKALGPYSQAIKTNGFYLFPVRAVSILKPANWLKAALKLKLYKP